ncbi:hypothetical protein JL720_12228 [Aureococcus anophagefferens]|nr:hypothetical protein JL720_12228 [Aureococcus anophagefferens]
MRVFTMLHAELDDESNIEVLRATAKQMLRSGKLLYKKHVKRSKREENARRRMKQSGLSPKDATAHEIKTPKLNYSAFTAMRKELGEHGTKEKRVTGQTVIPSASPSASTDLDAYVAQKGLMCAGEGEMWHADHGKIMPSTFDIYGYQARTTPKTSAKSPQMDEHAQPVVLYPTKQRKRKLDEKARAATAYATACSEGVDDDASDDDDAAEHDDDFEGMYQAEPNEEGDACTVLAAGKLKTKRDEVGKNLGPMVETLLAEEERRKDSSMPICCCFTLDKVGQYEFGPFRCATVLKFWELLSPHDRGRLASLDRATAAIQTGLDSASFAHRKAKGSDAAAWKAGTTKLRVFSMPAKRAKKISWETDPSMPATFQGHADAMGKLMVEIWGPRASRPTSHIIAGTCATMELYGPLYRHQNEGQERFNGRLTGRKKRHSQNGGACNRGAELRRRARRSDDFESEPEDSDSSEEEDDLTPAYRALGERDAQSRMS